MPALYRLLPSVAQCVQMSLILTIFVSVKSSNHFYMKSLKYYFVALLIMITMTGFAQQPQDGANAVLDNIHSRKSVRSYTDEPVSVE